MNLVIPATALESSTTRKVVIDRNVRDNQQNHGFKSVTSCNSQADITFSEQEPRTESLANCEEKDNDSYLYISISLSLAYSRAYERANFKEEKYQQHLNTPSWKEGDFEEH